MSWPKEPTDKQGKQYPLRIRHQSHLVKA